MFCPDCTTMYRSIPGHANIQTTMIYDHPTSADLRNAVEGIA